MKTNRQRSVREGMRDPGISPSPRLPSVLQESSRPARVAKLCRVLRRVSAPAGRGHGTRGEAPLPGAMYACPCDGSTAPLPGPPAPSCPIGQFSGSGGRPRPIMDVAGTTRTTGMAGISRLWQNGQAVKSGRAGGREETYTVGGPSVPARGPAVARRPLPTPPGERRGGVLRVSPSPRLPFLFPRGPAARGPCSLRLPAGHPSWYRNGPAGPRAVWLRFHVFTFTFHRRIS